MVVKGETKSGIKFQLDSRIKDDATNEYSERLMTNLIENEKNEFDENNNRIDKKYNLIHSWI